MEEFSISGTVKIFGAPAEEQTIARPYFVRDGYFDDVDIALHPHLHSTFKTEYGLIQSANIAATFTFHGVSAHAGAYPWRGRDALDAVVLMDVGMAQFREHFEPGMTAHRIISNGGDQPNIIPSEAAAYWFFRGPTAETASSLFEAGQRIARGAAMMTQTDVSIESLTAVWPARCNHTVAEVMQRNIERVGMPAWTEEEHGFAKAVQRENGVPEVGLEASTVPLRGMAKQSGSSNDGGDISWNVPMGRLWFPANIPNAPAHHWSAGAALATSIAHRGNEAGTKVIALTALDFLADPELVLAAKESFREEVGETVYAPLLPADSKPPIHLNAELMERHRPAMEPHYVRERPTFKR
jgi:aminobenzoyl-glutamate utilization protein B